MEEVEEEADNDLGNIMKEWAFSTTLGTLCGDDEIGILYTLSAMRFLPGTDNEFEFEENASIRECPIFKGVLDYTCNIKRRQKTYLKWWRK